MLMFEWPSVSMTTRSDGSSLPLKIKVSAVQVRPSAPPPDALGSRRVTKTQEAKRRVEDQQQRHPEQRCPGHVPRPWPHEIEQARRGWLAAQVQVIGSGGRVNRADHQHIGNRDLGDSDNCAAARPLAEADDQKECCGHDAPMRQVVLEERKAREVLW